MSLRHTMSLIRQIILGISSLVASTVIWIVILLGTIAVSVGIGSPVSIPLVIDNEMGEDATMTNSSVQFVGLFVGILVLGTIIYLTSRWLDSKRKQIRAAARVHHGGDDASSTGQAVDGAA